MTDPELIVSAIVGVLFAVVLWGGSFGRFDLGRKPMGAFSKPPSQRDKASRYQAEKLASGVNADLASGRASLTPAGQAGMAMAGFRPRKPIEASRRPAIFRRGGSR